VEDTNGCTERCLNLDGLGKVFWGYFLILLDFRVNGLDILPDFVGYFLIIAGLAGLSAESVWFGKAKPFAWISLLLSLSDIYQVTYPVGSVPTWIWLYSLTVGAAVLFLQAALQYCILRGLREAAAQCQEWFLVDRGQSLFFWLLGVHAVNFLLVPCLLFVPSGWMPFFWLIPIIGLFFHVAFLFYLRSARRLLDGRSPGYEGEVPPMKPGSLRSLLLFAASVMAAGWLLVGAGYLCTDALYLFPALRFPPEVSDTLGLSYHDFRRPVRVICRSGEEGGTSPSVTDDPCVARELLLEVCRSIGQPLPWNRPPEPPADAGGRFYTLEMHCRSQTVLTVQLQEDWPYILVNSTYYELPLEVLERWEASLSSAFSASA
jgi:hypothetical protein